MSNAMTVAELTGRERPSLAPADLSQYQQKGRYLRAPQWHSLLKDMAASLHQVLHVGGRYARRVLCTIHSALAQERERSAYRHALRALNAQTLKDIGLHHSEISWALGELPTAGKLSRLSAWSVQD
jgi:uncharacterized protein YjiS (DUF1127 family)